MQPYTPFEDPGITEKPQLGVFTAELEILKNDALHWGDLMLDPERWDEMTSPKSVGTNPTNSPTSVPAPAPTPAPTPEPALDPDLVDYGAFYLERQGVWVQQLELQQGLRGNKSAIRRVCSPLHSKWAEILDKEIHAFERAIERDPTLRSNEIVLTHLAPSEPDKNHQPWATAARYCTIFGHYADPKSRAVLTSLRTKALALQNREDTLVV